MRFPTFVLAAFGAAALLLGGCSTAPETGPDRTQLHNDAQASLNDFKTQDPSLDNVLHNAYGFAIFPSIGKGAVGVGGAYGQGEVYQQGNRVGYADMTQATVGASIGGETYAELIVFQNADALQRFQSGQLTFAADASAVAAKAGAAADANWQNGVTIFVSVKGGLMTEASVGGQKFNYQPL
ncbi:MAG TPA: YSC84-related protein [Tepidisphaeraceae bacterium]|jgi:lipid-binding SYLF domain-containing protein|nr:YSC84-related protein [Tepidisphaeraceae bacterium]